MNRQRVYPGKIFPEKETPKKENPKKPPNFSDPPPKESKNASKPPGSESTSYVYTYDSGGVHGSSVHYHYQMPCPIQDQYNIKLVGFTSETTIALLETTFSNIPIKSILLAKAYVQFNFRNEAEYRMAVQFHGTSGLVDSHPFFFEEREVTPETHTPPAYRPQ